MASGAAAAAAAAAIAQAVNASGAIVRLEPSHFRTVLERQERPLVVHAKGGFFSKEKYLTGYKGLAFFTQSREPLRLPADVELVEAGKIWVPE